MNISFNPEYHLKPDEGRVLLMPSEMFRSLQDGSDNSYESVIHPIYAMILAFLIILNMKKELEMLRTI